MNKIETKCTVCGSTNVTVCNIVDTDEDTGQEEIMTDLHDAHCNDCGWDFLYKHRR